MSLLSNLDFSQVLKAVYDGNSNTLRVSVIDGSTGDGSGFEVIISHTSDSIRLGDGTNYITSTTIGPKTALDVNVINTAQIVTSNFDSVTTTYPSATQEVYQFRVGGISGTVQQTVTVNYTDSTKNFILNAVRT